MRAVWPSCLVAVVRCARRHDANGNQTSLAQPRGTVASCTHDMPNRLTNLRAVHSATTVQAAPTLALAGISGADRRRRRQECGRTATTSRTAASDAVRVSSSNEQPPNGCVHSEHGGVRIWTGGQARVPAGSGCGECAKGDVFPVGVGVPVARHRQYRDRCRPRCDNPDDGTELPS